MSRAQPAARAGTSETGAPGAVRRLRPVLASALLFRRQRHALPQTLNFFVTSRCNARCDFCLYWDRITNPVAKERELSVEEVERVARQYGPLHYLALSGGEPFVRSDLAAICQAFIDHCGTAVVDIPSNFYFRDCMVETLENAAARNPGVVFDVQLSLDHVGERHDVSRQVPGLYVRARETFRELARLRERLPNLRLKVSIVYLERNRDHLDEIVATVRREFDCDRLQLSYPQRLLPREGGDAEARADVGRYQAAAARLVGGLPLRNVADLHTLGVRSVKAVYRDLLAQAVSGRRPTGEYCDAGRHILVLDEKGDVHPCEPLWESIGNVREHDYDVGRILRGPRYQGFRDAHLGPGKCNCTWSCAMHSYVSVRPAMLPRIGLEAARILGRHLSGGESR